MCKRKRWCSKNNHHKKFSYWIGSKRKKVLAIDLDPSANLTTALGIHVTKEQKTILDIFKLSKDCEDVPEGYAIMQHEEGIDVICSVKELHAFESELICAIQREIVLRRYLISIKDDYDYIFIDCPAGLGIYVTNALFCADSVIIPVQPQFLGVGAMQNLFSYINQVRKLNGTLVKPEVLGILFTMVRINTNNDRDVMAYLEILTRGKSICLIHIFLIPSAFQNQMAREKVFLNMHRKHLQQWFMEI